MNNDNTLNDSESMAVLYEGFLNAVKEVIQKKSYEIINDIGIEASNFAVVHAISVYSTDEEGNITSVERADVILSNGDKIENLTNATGMVLAPGDKVKIYGSPKNMSNRYIGHKYG